MPSISTHGGADQWTYSENEALACGGSTGFEYLFPVSRWRGFGGGPISGDVPRPYKAAALLRATSRSSFPAVHVPLFHPFVVAKMGATLHIWAGDAEA